MDIGKVFPSRYLKAGDLDGRDVPVTIKDVKLEAVGQGQNSKPVLYFKGTDKGLVLNVTNSKRIAAIAGSDDTDDWRGCKITLYATETDFQGETVECIRVRVPKGTKRAEVEVKKKAVKAKKAVEPEPDDPIPVVEDEPEIERDVDPDDDDDDRVPF